MDGDYYITEEERIRQEIKKRIGFTVVEWGGSEIK